MFCQTVKKNMENKKKYEKGGEKIKKRLLKKLEGWEARKRNKN